MQTILVTASTSVTTICIVIFLVTDIYMVWHCAVQETIDQLHSYSANCASVCIIRLEVAAAGNLIAVLKSLAPGVQAGCHGALSTRPVAREENRKKFRTAKRLELCCRSLCRCSGCVVTGSWRNCIGIDARGSGIVVCVVFRL